MRHALITDIQCHYGSLLAPLARQRAFYEETMVGEW